MQMWCLHPRSRGGGITRACDSCPYRCHPGARYYGTYMAQKIEHLQPGGICGT